MRPWCRGSTTRRDAGISIDVAVETTFLFRSVQFATKVYIFEHNLAKYCPLIHRLIPYTDFHRLRTFGALAPVLRTVAYRHALPPPGGGTTSPKGKEFEHRRCGVRRAEGCDCRNGRSMRKREAFSGPEHEHQRCVGGGRRPGEVRRTDVRSLRRPKVFEWGLQI